MTSAERVMAALEHRSPDRTPLFEYVMHNPVAEALLGRPYTGDDGVFVDLVRQVGHERVVRRRAVDMVDLAQRLGFDMLYVYPPWEPPPREAQTETPPAAPQPDDPVERVRARNRGDAQATVGLGDRQKLMYLAVREECARREMDLPILAPAYGHGVWTDVDLMQTMLLDPPTAHEHFALATRACLAMVEAYLELGIRQIGVGGDFSGDRPIISAEAYRRFIAPEVRTLSRRIHQGGAYAVNASDGDLWYVIEDFLFGCEVDGYLEIDPQAGMDLAKLKRLYGRRITFYGNMDCCHVLSFAAPEEVRRRTLALIEAGAGDGGHILCSNNAITASVPVANYLAMIAAYRDHFGLPALTL